MQIGEPSAERTRRRAEGLTASPNHARPLATREQRLDLLENFYPCFHTTRT